MDQGTFREDAFDCVMPDEIFVGFLPLILDLSLTCAGRIDDET